ncbi:immunoglobulin lambda-like polypeptide 1 isoform X10 [Pseudophryne corroboree]|uniref:immunoglobulin lambda-like polypeptide 1 isoform X10 n=1 Tax=Pseudophryne corroboree TaxID=495146 RepID=UPI003081BE59
MFWAAPFITVILCCTHCAAQSSVTQTPSVTASPGSTVTIPCVVSGFSISDRYVYWFQQKTGNKPQYLLWYDNDSNKNQGTGVPDRFSGSKDTSKNTGYLSIKRIVLEDDANYFCGMWHTSVFIFGDGTKLDVTSGEVKPPSVFIYRASEEEMKTNKATTVCAMSDYTPNTVTVEWQVDGVKWTNGVHTSMVSKQKDNTYMQSSLLTMSSSEYTKHNDISCKVTHQGKDIVKTVKRSECV